MVGAQSIRRRSAPLWYGIVLLLFVTAQANLAFADGGRACTCPDGRQFPIGASLYGNGSARVTISDFTQDAGQVFETGRLPVCRDLILLGQVIRRKEVASRPYLKREIVKRGKIPDACQTQIQFTERKKSYDFFAEDGAAINLNDSDELPETRASNETNEGDGTSRTDSPGTEELAGKDLIRLIPRESPVSDPTRAPFTADELKEGAYFVVPKRLRALPAVAENPAATLRTASIKRPLSIWAGSLGRIHKSAGFRSGQLWQVELFAHTGAPSIWETLASLPANVRRRDPVPNRFVLAAGDIIEINRFLDQHGTEWTTFGEESADARERDALGTTILPEIYVPRPLALEDNVEAALQPKGLQGMRPTALELVFVRKTSLAPQPPGPLVLDEESKSGSTTPTRPDLFRQQCFIHPRLVTTPTAFRVTDFEIKVFRPTNSAQVSEDYYAVDLAFQLNSGSTGNLPAVCRFPLATIDPALLERAKRILSSHFDIGRSDGQQQAMP